MLQECPRNKLVLSGEQSEAGCSALASAWHILNPSVRELSGGSFGSRARLHGGVVPHGPVAQGGGPEA